jgi:hypothetical protein
MDLEDVAGPPAGLMNEGRCDAYDAGWQAYLSGAPLSAVDVPPAFLAAARAGWYDSREARQARIERELFGE